MHCLSAQAWRPPRSPEQQLNPSEGALATRQDTFGEAQGRRGFPFGTSCLEGALLGLEGCKGAATKGQWRFK
eukprot:14268719-Alexandrium_andersonii.AAC.1